MALNTPKNLKYTIAIYFVVANIAIGLVAFGGTAYNFYWQIRDMTFEGLQWEAESRASAIADWLRLTALASSHYSLLEASRVDLEDYYADRIDRATLARRSAALFGDLPNFGADVKGLARLDRRGQKIYELGQAIPANFRPTLAPGRGEPVLSLFTLEAAAPPKLLLSTPILDREGEPLGMDIISLDTEPLNRLVTEGSDFSFATRTYLTALEDETLALIISIPPSKNGDLPPEIRQALEQTWDEDPRDMAFARDGLVYGAVKVNGTSWRLAITANENELADPMLQQMQRVTRLFLLFFVIALIGLWFFALSPLTGEVGKATGALEEEVEEATEKLLKESEGRKKTETRLVVATHKAQAAKQAKSQFLVNLSHEIRTPLNAVIGMTDLTLFTELTDEQLSYLTEVKNSANVLLKQINDLLDLSKLEDGLMLTESRDFDLKDLLTQLARPYEAVCRDRSLGYAWKIDESLEFWRRGDALRVRQVLDFLLDNAFKFTRAGGVELTVRLAAGPAGPGAEADPDRLEFLVRDTGIGIEPDRLEFIFDPFTQADSSLTRASGGTGMGLAVTKRLVELMGGTISVDSTPGQGSLFTITLSLPPAAARGRAGEQRAEPLAEEELQGHLAVLADDNEVNRTVLKGYLARWGLTAHAFDDGLSALEFLKNQPEVKPDILLMDSRMPGLKPEELRARLEKEYPKVPLIFLSSTESGLSESSDGRADGLTVTLGKPVARETLGDCLRSLLAEAGRRKQPGGAGKKNAPAQLTKTENPRKILVVDDNQLNQKLAATLLTKRGHTVTLADNGQEALKTLEAGGIDLVLMDIQMPVMDGLTAVRKIRAAPGKYGPFLPVVAMTAHALSGDQESFISAGMTGYISKPFKPQELIAAVEQQFERRDKPSDNGGAIVAVELNRAAILENFMDDEELLFESIDLFLERVASRMEELRKTVAAKNPEAYMPEAHTLKGMIGIFSTAGAFECAKKLELKGREKVTDGIDEDLKALEGEVEALVAALRAWRAA
ncbi:hypothetical protein FACS189460_1780 [Deltaproteobacteria bacterium]|nr:hypothetical protein FACS189460_1780 [Deltaproteobacteria bacterium]